MKVFKEQEKLKNFLKQQNTKNLGLVPTMGALHQGHLALVKKAINDNDKVIVSIFVNPTQFNDPKDLAAYPKTFSDDLQQLNPFQEKIVIYAPDVSDLYPNNVRSKQYEFGRLENTMEGASRAGHFQGMATIVHKLLSGFTPTHAYFGEKDYQQLVIIHALVDQFKLPVSIVNCPIIREKDGLAMSSRNQRLTLKQRTLAPLIYQTLLEAKNLKADYTPTEIMHWVKSIFDKQNDFELDYFCIADAKSLQPVNMISTENNLRAFIAVKLGGIRLIDNINF